jgi:response regulator RpfG family c-di-GMP phosphodiesterase
MDSYDKNIVVVDDERHICGIIAEALSSENYNVETYTNPGRALDYIANNDVDLVLTDLVMGEFSGVQVLEAALVSHPDAVVILMTAHPTVQAAISVLKKGAYDFLIKPFKLELLKSTIKRGLEHQRILRENLSLKGQVEFLKLSQANSSGMDIDRYLEMVAETCRKEFTAAAVGLIEIDPEQRMVLRKVCLSDSDEYGTEVSNEVSLDQFNYTKSTKPVVSVNKAMVDEVEHNKISVSQPIFVSRKLHGVINILIMTRFGRFTPGQTDLLAILTSAAASAIANHRLYQDLQDSYLQAIRGLTNAIEARDQCTAGHTDRVCTLAKQVAMGLNWDAAKIQDCMIGCTLHDIGKIGVPDSVLNKPGLLTEPELELMKNHPELGLKIIGGIDVFKPAIPYISSHHEWFNGNGYPSGLKGEEIPVEGRLLAVVDTFDAIMSDRPYREGAGLKVAVRELLRYRDTQFDPEIVDRFIAVLKSGKINLKEVYNCDDDVQALFADMVTEKARV